jgi:hypothetical protein
LRRRRRRREGGDEMREWLSRKEGSIGEIEGEKREIQGSATQGEGWTMELHADKEKEKARHQAS